MGVGRKTKGDDVKERPIIFSGSMVRSILQSQKQQTRRVVKKVDELGCPTGDCTHDKQAECDAFLASVCPFGAPGERLWVRETHAGDNLCGWVYRADHPTADIRAGDLDDGEQSLRRWTPAIHMKREACRLLLDVRAVRIEQLLDITVADSFAEGIVSLRCPTCHLAAYGLPGWKHDDLQKTPIEAYWHLWDMLNERRGYGRSKNPWVWVVEFRRTA